MYERFACMHVCRLCGAQCPQRSKDWDPLELELWVVLNFSVSAGKQTRHLHESIKCSSPLCCCLSGLLILFLIMWMCAAGEGCHCVCMCAAGEGCCCCVYVPTEARTIRWNARQVRATQLGCWELTLHPLYEQCMHSLPTEPSLQALAMGF